MYGYSFEWICMKSGTLHPYTLQMVAAVSDRRSSPRARAPRAHTLLQVVERFAAKFGSSGPSAVGGRVER